MPKRQIALDNWRDGVHARAREANPPPARAREGETCAVAAHRQLTNLRGLENQRDEFDEKQRENSPPTSEVKATRPCEPRSSRGGGGAAVGGRARSDQSGGSWPSPRRRGSDPPPSPGWSPAPCCCSGKSLSRARSAGSRARRGGARGAHARLGCANGWLAPATSRPRPLPAGGPSAHVRGLAINRADEVRVLVLRHHQRVLRHLLQEAAMLPLGHVEIQASRGRGKGQTRQERQGEQHGFAAQSSCGRPCAVRARATGRGAGALSTTGLPPGRPVALPGRGQTFVGSRRAARAAQALSCRSPGLRGATRDRGGGCFDSPRY